MAQIKLTDILQKKVIFITGKGGVGKSTVSAGIAEYLSRNGERVMAIDADPAHSLPDVFGITNRVYDGKRGFSGNGKLLRVYDDAKADLLLLNPVCQRTNYTGPHQIMWLAELGKELGFYSNLGRMSEFFTMADALCKSFHNYSHFVIDNEPSAGTLDMIENIDGWLKGIDSVRKYKTILQMVLGTTIADKELVREVKDLLFSQNGARIDNYKGLLSSVKQLFKDEMHFEPIIVANPEDAVIRETHRLKQELEERLNIKNRYIIFNKVSSDESVNKLQLDKIKRFKDETGTTCFTIPSLDSRLIDLSNGNNARKSLRRIINEEVKSA